MKPILILMLIATCAFLIRAYRFGEIPSGVNRDEAALGYNAYSILKTGRDEYGRAVPLRLESFGDWKQPVYSYLSIPIIAIAGLNESSTRLVSLLAGVSMIFSSYFIMRSLLPQQKSILAAAASAGIFLAFNPWHFHFSRIASEALVATSLFSWAVVFLIRPSHKLRDWITGCSLLIFSMLTYHGALITVPLWTIIFSISQLKHLSKKPLLILPIVIVFIVISGLFYNTFFSAENVKAKGVVIFDLTNQEKVEYIYSKRDDSFISKLAHNQYTFILTTFVHNYSQTFWPDFLFTRGGKHPSFNIPGFGNFLVIEIVFAVMGVIWLLKKRPHSWHLLIGWLCIAPISAAITRDGIHSAREIFLLPATQITAGLGVIFTASMLRGKSAVIVGLVALFTIVVAIPFYRAYFTDYALSSDHIFHGYMKPVMKSVYATQDSYHQLYITVPFESPYIFYTFYNQISPADFQTTVKRYPVGEDGFHHVRSLGNLLFVERNPEEIKQDINKPENNLIYSRPDSLPDWLTTHQVWENKQNQVEIVAWEEADI